MNHREQMIEKVITAILDETNHNGIDCSPRPDSLYYVAAAAVDALLPQVSTVEELEELPVYTILVRFSVPTVDWLPNPMGHPVVISGGYRRYLHSGSATTAEELLAGGPLAVVWQP